LDLYNVAVIGEKETAESYSYFYALLAYGDITIRQGCSLRMINSVDTVNGRYLDLRVGTGANMAISHAGAACTLNGDWGIICQVESKGSWIRDNVNKPVINGSATGKRYEVAAQAICDTQGGGANYFPGSTAGTVDSTGFGVYK
jgi:hypothetical protein